MDHKEFDKIFKAGLEETRSFDRAEENWQALQPQLHPPKKRRRFVIWPFMAAAVIFFGITTYWFYNQTASLQEDVAELNEQLKQKEEQKRAIDNATSIITDKEVSQPNTKNKNGLNTTVQNEAPIKRDLKNNPPAISTENLDENDSPKNAVEQQNTLSNSPAVANESIATVDDEIKKELKKDLLSVNEAVKDVSLAEQFDFDYVFELINKFWLLEYERALPKFAILDNSIVDETADIVVNDVGRFSVGLNAGLAEDIMSTNNFLTQDVDPVGSESGQNTITFYQYSVHGNYDLNKNWQLNSSLGFEKITLFYDGRVAIPRVPFSSFETDGLGFNANTYSLDEFLIENFQQTEIDQSSWFLTLGIRRRLFSLKQLNVFAGAHASTHFLLNQKIEYSGSPFQNSIASDKAFGTIANKTTFALSPSLGIGSPIGKKFYWNLEAKYDFQVARPDQYLLPGFGVTLGAGYRF